MFSFVFVEDKMTHQYNTCVNLRQKMETTEQEKRELHEDVNSLKAEMDRVTALLESLVAAQNQLPPPAKPQVIVISEIATNPIVSAVPTRLLHQNQMPTDYPWGMPPNYLPENFNPTAKAPLVS